MTPKLFLLTFSIGVIASTANAESIEFETLDVDQSGGLSFTELLVAAPNLTAMDFAQLDSDASGDLSKMEFAEWQAPAEDKEN